MLTVLSISSAAFLFIMLQTSVLTPYVNDLAGESSAGIVLSGLIFSLQGISGALAAPFWGMQGQRRGFFKCLIIAMLSASLLYMTLGIPHALLPFAVMQFATGLCLAGISPMINALLVQVTPARDRATAFGLLYSFQEGGAGSGPLLGGFLASTLGMSFMYGIGGAFFAFIALLLLLASPEGVKKNASRKIEI